MPAIFTLTLNPVVDKSTSVEGIRPNIKLRCSSPVMYPGGGGINVSRALKKLGLDSLCIYLAGGPTGIQLDQLIALAGVRQQRISIAGTTRDNLAVLDTTTGLQYRFCIPGPEVSREEWEDSLLQLEEKVMEGDYLVASGKLPPGIPDDFYVRVAEICHRKNVRMVLDTSGPALVKGARAGVFLLKPNLGELSTLCGVTSITTENLEPLVRAFMKEKSCEILVVSLGARGALWAKADMLKYVAAPVVEQKSTIGAGDSMVAGMVRSHIQGKSTEEMVRFGVACGTAATMRPGTELCRLEDAERLFGWINA